LVHMRADWRRIGARGVEAEAAHVKAREARLDLSGRENRR
jgi:hypothetical protein